MIDVVKHFREALEASGVRLDWWHKRAFTHETRLFRFDSRSFWSRRLVWDRWSEAFEHG